MPEPLEQSGPPKLGEIIARHLDRGQKKEPWHSLNRELDLDPTERAISFARPKP